MPISTSPSTERTPLVASSSSSSSTSTLSTPHHRTSLRLACCAAAASLLFVCYIASNHSSHFHSPSAHSYSVIATSVYNPSSDSQSDRLSTTPLSSSPSSSSSTSSLSNSSSKPVVFAVIGDWGRLGNYHQNDTGNALAKVLDNTPEAQFIFSAGDNFYDNGVTSVTDPQFHQSFENIYTASILHKLPWYIAIGNHDHRGSVRAQILYSHQSARWNLPSRYFSLWLSPTLMAIFIDTTPFSDSREGQASRQKPFVNPQRQLEWLKHTLHSAPHTCRFFIMGHHNMYSVSVADHRGDVAVRNHIEPILMPYALRIVAYVAGHEHSLMHMKPYDGTRPVGESFDHFVSGGGSKLRPLVKPLAKRAKHWLDCCNVLVETGKNQSIPHSEWSASMNGFFIYRIDGNEFSSQAYDMHGKSIHQQKRILTSL